MKRWKVWLATVATLIIGVYCLAACGNSSVEGTYKLYSTTTNGVEVRVGKLVGLLTRNSLSVTLNKDGSVEFIDNLTGSGDTISGSWEKDENGNVTIDVPDYDVQYSKGKIIVTIVEGESYYTLKK